jgi:hypothetical protein
MDMPELQDIPAERIADVVSRAVAQAVREGGDPEAIVGRALAHAQGELGIGTPGVAARASVHAVVTGPPAAANGASARQVVTEDDVLAARAAGQDELRLRAGALVTPLARDAAQDKGVRLVEGA